MKIIQKRIHKQYSPVSVSCSLRTYEEIGKTSPLIQTYNAFERLFVPDRAGSPTVIVPEVNVLAEDGSIPNGLTVLDASTDELNWYVDDILLAKGNGGTYTVTPDAVALGWSLSDFDITTSGKYKGSISIFKNIYSEKSYSLSFSCKIADPRNGENIDVNSDYITLATIDYTDDQYKITADVTPVIMYDAFLDNMLNKDYYTSHNYPQIDIATNFSCNNYLRTISFTVYKGDAPLYKNNVSIKLYKYYNNILTEVTNSDLDVVEFVPFKLVNVDSVSRYLTLDMRLIDDATFVLIAYTTINDGSTFEVCRTQFSVHRQHSDYSVYSVNDCPIVESELERYDRCEYSSGLMTLPYGENVISTVWKTLTAHSGNSNGIVRGEGRSVSYNVKDAGIGYTVADSWISQWIEAEIKGRMYPLTDSTGDLFTDENGDVIIYND